MGSLYLAVEPGRATFDVSMADAEVLDVSMELRLEFMAVIHNCSLLTSGDRFYSS